MIQKLLCGMAIMTILFLNTACGTDDSITQAAEQSVQQFEEAGVENMKNDALFAAEAASASMLQVRLGELASIKAVSPEVQELARQLEQSHQRILEDLRTMAAHSNFVLPDSLGDVHQKLYEEVNSKSSIAFDLSYIKQALNQHKQLEKRYSDMGEHGNVMELKQFASKQVPLLRQHVQQAETLEDKVKDI